MVSIPDDRLDWFSQSILPHEPALRAWLKHKPLYGLEINDIVQETYAILAALESVKEIRSPKNYAFQTAYSIILRHIRRVKIVPIRAVANVEVLGAIEDLPSPEQQAADNEELRNVARLIALLPPKPREVFLLRRVEGLSQREIAHRLSLSESTVEKRMYRAIRLLIKFIGQGGKGSADALLDESEQYFRRLSRPKND